MKHPVGVAALAAGSAGHFPHNVYVVTIILHITYDSAKRARTLLDRGLDFEDAAIVFSDITFEIDDTRRDYGERRVICYGLLQGRLVVVGYTPRGESRHIFSMRKANAREKSQITPLLEI